MQYTIRAIPPTLDSELRQRAKAEGKSLNTVAIEALIRGTGLGDSPVRLRDLSDIVGTWQEDPEFDRAIADQDRVDEEMWRERAKRGSREKFEAALASLPDVEPDEYDKL